MGLTPHKIVQSRFCVRALETDFVKFFLLESKKDEDNIFMRDIWTLKAHDSTIYTLQLQDISPRGTNETRGIGFSSQYEIFFV